MSDEIDPKLIEALREGAKKLAEAMARGEIKPSGYDENGLPKFKREDVMRLWPARKTGV